MHSTEARTQALARRLRQLRTEHWDGRAITQGQLARAIGVGKPLSVPLISSWENLSNPKVPPTHRLEAYATFFATPRSIADEPYRMLPLTELTDDERASREALLTELKGLRDAAADGHRGRVDPTTGRSAASTRPCGQWHFPDGAEVTIVSSMMPEYMREKLPYADPTSPDYVEMYKYADLDALVELHGHIRATNPDTQVNLRVSAELTEDDYATHLVLLGGVDWNDTTDDLLKRIDVPVRQIGRDGEVPNGCFEVTDGSERLRFEPEISTGPDGRPVLLTDVAHFVRAPNPFDTQRTVTLCNGMFGRGTYAAVRTLTDARFRDRNEKFIKEQLSGAGTFSVLALVPILASRAVTPDWSNPRVLLHTWAPVR